MPGRRRDQRFTLSVPWEGALRVPADVVIEQYGEKEVSVVSTAPAHRDELMTLDANGSETLRESYEHLRPTGRVVVYGFHSLLSRGSAGLPLLRAGLGWFRVPSFNPFKMVDKNVGVLAFNLSYLFDELTIFREGVAEVTGALARGEIRCPPVTEVPFDDVQRSHTLLHSGQTIGKVALVL